MKFIVKQDNDRLDKFLSDSLKASRNQVSKLIRSGGVFINQKVIKKPSFLIKTDDEIYIKLPLKQDSKQVKKVDFDVDILHEDDEILVINKPPFLTVHDAPSVKDATLVDWLKSKNFTLSTLSGEERHGIVHRIDKQTSGALVIAKTNKAHEVLSNQLQDKSMGRYYLSLIDNPLKQDCIISKQIGRNSKNRLKMDIVSGGKEAKSAFCTLLKNDDFNIDLIAAKLFTGRTHQIRVHLKSISRHILGDNLYGFKSQKVKIPRVMLHAYILYFIHPATNRKLYIKAPLFDDFYTICEKYFIRNEIEKILKQNYVIDRFNSIDEWVCR